MRTHRLVIRSPLLAAVIMIAAALVATPAARAEDQIVRLVSVENGKCLQPVSDSHTQGDAIVQETCNGSVAQQWTDHAVSDGRHLINRSSGLCLDARGTASNGTPIQQWPCNQISNEIWSYGLDQDLLSSGISSGRWTHCIATPGEPDGLPMELRACDGSSAQRWNHPEG